MLTVAPDEIPLNWNGALLVGAVDPAPKLNEGDAPNENVDGAEPNAGGGAAAADWDENAKPLVVPADVWIGLVVVFDVAPKANNGVDVLAVEPKAENDGTDVGGLSIVVGIVPNEAVAPNAGVGFVVLVEITEGANGFGGLLAPNANGVLLDVVVVVFADGKLKPDDNAPPPNKDAVDVGAVFVVVAIDVDTSGKLLGNENPLIVEGTGNVKEAAAVVVVGAVAFDVKANKFGVVEEVVVAVVIDDDDDDNGITDKGGALVPNENRGSLSDETVEKTVVVAVVVINGVLPNDPNVTDVDTFISDDAVVIVVAGVIIEGMVEVLVAVVVFVDANAPKDWNVEGVFALSWKRLFGVLVTGWSKVVVGVPNREVVVEGNEAVVVTGGLITIFSLVVVGIVPNNGSVLVAVNGLVVVTSGGIEKVLSLVVVGGDVTMGVDSNGIVAWMVVTGVDTVGSSIIIISGVSFDDTDGCSGVGSIAKINRRNKI